MLNEIKKLLCNNFAWGVQRTHGSFLILNFGNPRLIVREPMISNLKALQKRKVTISSDCYIWVQNARWEITGPDRRSIANSSSAHALIDQACKELDGLTLIAIQHDEISKATAFLFEGDFALSTMSDGIKTEEQWSLFGDHIAFSMRGDGKFARETRERR